MSNEYYKDADATSLKLFVETTRKKYKNRYAFIRCYWRWRQRVNHEIIEFDKFCPIDHLTFSELKGKYLKATSPIKDHYTKIMGQSSMVTPKISKLLPRCNKKKCISKEASQAERKELKKVKDAIKVYLNTMDSPNAALSLR